MAKASKSQIKSHIKYNSNHYQKKCILFKKTEIGLIDKFCRDHNYTRNSFMTEAIKEKIEIETGKKFEDLVNKEKEQ